MSAAVTIDDGRRFRVRLCAALVAEFMYLIGRSALISAIESEFYLELVRTIWRLLFIVIYLWLFSDTVLGRRDRRPLPRHPLLIASVLISVATIPLVHQGSPFAWHLAALDVVAIPIVAMREELFYRGILQTALEKGSSSRLGDPGCCALLCPVAHWCSTYQLGDNVVLCRMWRCLRSCVSIHPQPMDCRCSPRTLRFPGLAALHPTNSTCDRTSRESRRSTRRTFMVVTESKQS
jgi:hypothetical protein